MQRVVLRVVMATGAGVNYSNAFMSGQAVGALT